MFAAGMDTSASTLEWVMSELVRHPHAMKRLQEEIDSTVGNHRKGNESDVACMKYLQCVVKETLRLYPAVPLALPHASIEPATLGQFYLPKNTTVLLNLWAIGRDPNVWGADALEFKPERFMEELGRHDNIMDLVSGQADFRMLPFSAGRRGCPGAAMAVPTIEIALAQLLHSFDLRVKGDPSMLDMIELSGSAMARRLPLYAFPTLRSGSSLYLTTE